MLDKSETEVVLKKVRRHVIELLPGRITGIRHLGACEPCGNDTQYCAHSVLFDAETAASFFVHFCTSCQLTSYERKQLDSEADFDAAVCEMCGYDWGH